MTPTGWSSARSSLSCPGCICARPRSRFRHRHHRFCRQRARRGGSDTLPRLHALMKALRREIRFDTDRTHSATTAAEPCGTPRRLPGPHPYFHRGGAPSRHPGALCRRPLLPRRRGDRADRRPRLGRSLCRTPRLGRLRIRPTESALTEAHVRVAIGLDYLGASPVRGTRFGGSGETLRVAVHVAQARQQSQN